MNKVQAKRLLNVAKALRESPAPRKFSMKKFVWGERYKDERIGGRYSKYGILVDYYVVNKEKNFCGTPACALGHYAARRDLQKLLKIVVVQRDAPSTPFAHMTYVSSDKSSNAYFSDDVVQNHFGLSEDETNELFGHLGCGRATTAQQAARYITKFVANKLKGQKA